MTIHNAYVALGSNLDNPHDQVLKAMDALDRLPTCQVLKRSSLYVTQPIGYLDQPDFVNAVVKLSTELDPLSLLKKLQDLEHAHGRIRSFKNGPRTLDCDLIFYDNLVMDTQELILPHPRMHERDFVLTPLYEIEPNFSLKKG